VAAGSKSNPDRHVTCAKCNYRYHNILGDGGGCASAVEQRELIAALLWLEATAARAAKKSASIPIRSPSIIVSLASVSPPIGRPSWARASTTTAGRPITSCLIQRLPSQVHQPR